MDVDTMAANIELLVVASNNITVNDIDESLNMIDRAEALGPLLNPAEWRRGDMFRKANMSKNVLQAIRDFKVTVSGIGKFESIP